MTDQTAEQLAEELAGARATIDHMANAMSWICGHDRQGLDHLDEAQREGHARESAVKQARQWAQSARGAEAERDGAYRERAHLVALLAAHYPAVIASAPDVKEPGWQIIYLRIGTWQASWHIAPRDADLFTRVEHVAASDPRAQWDGHTTDQKYTRIRSHARVLQLGGREPYEQCVCSSTQAGLELCARCPGHDRAVPTEPVVSVHGARDLTPAAREAVDALAAIAVRQMDADKSEPHTGLVVQPYRDHGEEKWVFRCWGTETCDGYLSLDHTSQQSAERARDLHVAEEHQEQQP
ncbi:hypothetical protein OHB14_36580 [Streptomyces sp. NBC_01613]|uniref:hypothetical protein n=1 Tax=Streptomyces sp. NBC_01613 TaxID=2975896 RepID=UPI00386D313C